jgi:hypothetical protein
MKRFVVLLTAWALGLAWVVGGVAPVSASAQVPAAVVGGSVSASRPLTAASLVDPGAGLFTALPTARVFDGDGHHGASARAGRRSGRGACGRDGGGGQH